jgi:L-seryl-tRNA(Ser) seleniumtransferase
MAVSDVRRKVPSVDAILRSAPGQRAARAVGRAVLKRCLVAELDAIRAAAAKGEEPPIADEILARAVAVAARATGGLTTVINATGVILHTNLGRAPLADEAVRAVTTAARNYTDLEVDRSSGARGSRGTRAELLLAALVDAEAAMIVNNCAAALVLALAALAKGKRVLVSRGELIEIGGEFRIPEIMRASGATLVEVGTTNRTRPADYRDALDERTAAILQVHPSNYRVVGFTAAATTPQLAEIATKAGIPLLYDVGSGLLDPERGFPNDEPSVHQALVEGADVVTFSGDKLLGGPQAGCIVGHANVLARLRKHPLARAMRIDKLQAAALEATLALYATGAHERVPVHRMIHEPEDAVVKRARAIAEAIGGDLEGAHVVRCQSVVGGGSVPGRSIASWGVRVRCPDPPAFASRLRTGAPSVFCRSADDHVLLDARTITDAQVPHVVRAVQYALEGDDLDDED